MHKNIQKLELAQLAVRSHLTAPRRAFTLCDSAFGSSTDTEQPAA